MSRPDNYWMPLRDEMDSTRLACQITGQQIMDWAGRFVYCTKFHFPYVFCPSINASMATVRLWFISFCLHAAISGDLLAQKNVFLSFTKLTVKEGLASPNIRKILRDKYNFTWIATQEGLSRFDGKSFVNFLSNESREDRKLLSSDVFDLAVDGSGESLWVLTTYGGLTEVNFESCKVVGKYPINIVGKERGSFWFTKMCFFNSRLYIGTNEGYIIVFDLQKKAVINFTKVLTGNGDDANIELVTEFQKKIFTFSNHGAITTLSPADLHTLEKIRLDNKPDVNETHFRGVDVISDSLLVMATSTGLRSIGAKGVVRYGVSDNLAAFPGALSNCLVYAICGYADKLMVSSAAGLFELNLQLRSFTKFTAAGNKVDDDYIETATAICPIGSSFILGSPLGLALVKNIASPFTRYEYSRTNGSVKITHLLHLCALNDSILYAGANEGLYTVNVASSEIKRLGKPETYFSAFPGPNKTMIACRLLGTDVISADGRNEPVGNVFPELDTLNNDAIISYASYKDSLIFLASENRNGLFIWDIKRRRLDNINVATRPLRLGSNVINRLFIDRSDILWIVCDNVLSTYNPISRTLSIVDIKDPDKRVISIMMDICENRKSRFLAVYGLGIVELDTMNRVTYIYDARQGLKNTGLYKLFPIGDSLILASTNNGIALIDLYQKSIAAFYDYDGLQSNSFEETSGNIMGGKILMGGINGLTLIDPSKFRKNMVPPGVYLGDIKIVRPYSSEIIASSLSPQYFSIPSDVIQTTVKFLSINYTAPEKVNFAYRIIELADNWTFLGTQNSIDLVGVSPGTYTLEFKASNEDGVWSENRHFVMVFQPRWYQSKLFKASLLILGLLIGYVIYRYRLAYKLNQFKMEEKLRNAIAADLHDEIGGTLTSIRIFVDMELMDSSKKFSAEIKEAIVSASSSLRDIIWLLDTSNSNANDLLDRVCKFADPISLAKDIKISISKDKNLDKVNIETPVLRDLYLIMKEFFTNSFKYSGCSMIQIVAKIHSSGNLSLSISDNGKGFNTRSAIRGNGLENMIVRANRSGYAAVLKSEMGMGCSLELIPTGNRLLAS